jgi:hypothetical protein
LIPALLLLLLAVPAGCQSEAERLQGETLFHMENALKILAMSPGNTDAACSNLQKYLDDNRERLTEIRSKGVALLQRMDAAEREAFARRALDRARPLREKLETVARTFPDPPRVLMKLQAFF